MDIALICDPITSLEGSVRPALCLAEELAKKHNVFVLSPSVHEYIEKRLIAKGITILNLRSKFLTEIFGPSAMWLEAWIREAFLKLNSRRFQNEFPIVINFSNVFSVPSDIWYLQGPPSVALEDMKMEFSWFPRIIYKFLKPFIYHADRRLIRNLNKDSLRIVANSKFCASMYLKFGVHVDDVIYPPIDCSTFKPSTSKPSSDYVLTYFGKETKFSVLSKIADKGVKIKAFGSKAPFLGKKLTTHSNIEFLGRISIKELVKAYSNALFTVFPFSHEPFGYIPLESIACGTPVLTYDFQGPSEYIIDGITGWLVKTNDELVTKAVELWEHGYPYDVRNRCVKEALKFDVKFYIEKWCKILFKTQNAKAQHFKGL
jgi:glycosyltransferase involved in cell wall biosynthesis